MPKQNVQPRGFEDPSFGPISVSNAANGKQQVKDVGHVS